jgi:serine protease
VAGEHDALRTLRREFGVETASLNYRLEASQRPANDEFYAVQWNFDLLEVPAAWEINSGASSSVIVAVIDTGLNTVSDVVTFFSPVGQIAVRFAAVPDLVTASNIVQPYDFVYRDAFPLDLGGHGTHVAGTIAQATNNNIGAAGIAYSVRLMPLKVISGGTLEPWDDVFFPDNRAGSVDIIAEAIRYAADNGAHVINLSLGGPAPAPALRSAISYAVSRGSFVAIAAGNRGRASDGNPREYPAAYGGEIAGAMTVGAVNRDLRRAEYSGVHPYVEICAPGGDSRSYQRGVSQVTYDEDVTLLTVGPEAKRRALLLGFRPRVDRFGVFPLTGTSMAAPHVAGTAALLYSQGIRDPVGIEEAIKRFARPINARTDECGAGLVDPRRALRGLGLAR